MNYTDPNLPEADVARLRFIQRLFGMRPPERTHLLRIERDAEIEEFKRVALDQQHFEMAVVMKDEIARRTKEVRV